jgi:DHA1 family tetracycline resistance protein-like MFS transporter
MFFNVWHFLLTTVHNYLVFLSASAWSNVALNVLALVCNPVLGSISDVQGRRYMVLASLVLTCIPALVFMLLQKVPTLDPFWFYVSNSLVGAINYMSTMFAALSDVVPAQYRAPSYGLMLAGIYGGFALAPSIPLYLSACNVAAVSFALSLTALLVAVFFLPETLPEHIQQENLAARNALATPVGVLAWTWSAVTRPIREVAILNRDWVIRLVAAGSFFSAMVFASDATLVMYYIEDELDVHTKDIATMFIGMGIAGILLQGFALQPLVQCLGEKGLLITTFCSGILHNFLYGVAKNKTTLGMALMLSQLTKVNFPILSSLASKDASSNEQGRVQGALFATNSIAYAVGPLSMEYVYHHTKNKKNFGPGFMFIYAAALYAIGTVLVALIPQKNTGQQGSTGDIPNVVECQHDERADLEEPLLPSVATSSEI